MPFLLSPGAPASAQTNPTEAACGLPAAGQVRTSVTYTLIADCTQTDALGIGHGSDTTGITVTIDGGGFTITAPPATAPDQAVFKVQQNATLNLSNVTIAGGGRLGSAAIVVTNARFSSSFTNITMRDSVHTAIQFNNEAANTPITHSLSSVLIEGGTGRYEHADHGIPLGLHTLGPVSLNINNIVLRRIFGGNAAIGANEGYIPSVDSSIGTITFTGCFTVDGVFPRVYYGDIVDNRTGPCSDPIGNGGSAAIVNQQAPVSDCGMPLSGYIYGSYTFDLIGDCALTGRLTIPGESDVVINGNRFTIDASGFADHPLVVAGPFSLNNAVVSGSIGFPIVSYLDNVLTVNNVIFRGNSRPLVFQDSIASLDTVLIENHSQTAQLPSAIFVNLTAQVTIRDTIIRNNTGGLGAIYTGPANARGGPPSTTLEGCITLEGNTPGDILDPDMLLIDNRTGPCPTEREILVVAPPVTSDPGPGNNPHNPQNSPIASCDGPAGAVAMGASACVFRFWWNGDAVAQIYEINQATAEGFHKLTVTQRQVDAVDGERIVAVSPDGRALVVAWPDNNVTIKFGPNPEGKILHVTFAGGLHGPVLGSLSTYGPAPGLPYIGLALPLQIQPGQAPQPAQPSIAQFDCMVTTKDILNLRDAPDGDVMFFIPYDVTLTAFERAGQWFQVDYHGDRGWLHADYVRPQGSCG